MLHDGSLLLNSFWDPEHRDFLREHGTNHLKAGAGDVDIRALAVASRLCHGAGAGEGGHAELQRARGRLAARHMEILKGL